MDIFGQLIGPGDHVAEVGGHIGYISQWFAHLVGPAGRVVVFEPGPNNLPYLHANTDGLPQVQVVERAVGDTVGEATLFVEDLTGQNNSLVPGFEGLAVNSDAAGLQVTVTPVVVAVTTLDAHFAEPPDFIKIDVEGYELPVLRGARTILREHQPLLTVEIQADQDSIRRLADDHGYAVLDESLVEIPWDAPWSGNSFWFHRERRATRLMTLRDVLQGPQLTGAAVSRGRRWTGRRR